MKVSHPVLEGRDYWQMGLPISVRREKEWFSLALHLHDFVEIQYVAEGKGFHYIGETRLYVEKGDTFVIPVGTPHVYRPSSESPRDELIVYNCLFSPETAAALQAVHPSLQGVGSLFDEGGTGYRRYKDDRQEVRPLIESMHLEYKLSRPGFEAVLHGQLIQLLVALMRLEIRLSEPYPSETPLHRAIRFVNERFREPVRLKELADLLPVSTSHFQRLFHHATGQSVTEYVQNLRIRESCELLAGTTWSVPAISEKVGYKDTKFFYRLFRKKLGMSPHQYRKNNGTIFAAEIE